LRLASRFFEQPVDSDFINTLLKGRIDHQTDLSSMQTWYFFSLFALLLLGGQRFLYKVAAAKNCGTFLTTFCFMLTVAMLSSSLLALRPPDVPGARDLSFLIFISLINSLTFVSATLCHIQALKYMPATVAYPLIRMNIVLVVLFAVFVLQESLQWSQMLGLLLSFAAIWVLSRDSAPEDTAETRATGLLLVFLAMLSGALSAISSKYAAQHTDLLAFIALSYIFSSLFTLFLAPRMFTPAPDQSPRKLALGIGLAMGLLNFTGFYLFLKALALGPLAIVASINGMHFLVAVVLSVVFFQEKLTTIRVTGLILALGAIFFLRG
jgi:drug/metabolite transporter (DMT)-like permease